MSLLERIATGLPSRLARPMRVATGVAAVVGSSSLFVATVYGSIVWAVAGLAGFVVAGALWHLIAAGFDTPFP